MSDYLTRGAIANAVNFPSISAEEAPRLRPYIELAEKLGLFVGQIADTGVDKISVVYEGVVAGQKTKAITAAALAGLLQPILEDVNPISAPIIAKERGVVIEEVTRDVEADYESLVTLRATTARGEISVSGTVFHDGKPRIVRVGAIAVEAEFSPSMIYVTNEDKPGFIGRFAGLLGEAGVNIATFALGRDRAGGAAVALVAIDGAASEDTVAAIHGLPGVKRVTAMKF